MIKRIIFDLDDTLIKWKSEYVSALAETIKKYNYNLDANYVSGLIDDYDAFCDHYDCMELVSYINDHIDGSVDINFLNDFLFAFGYMSEPDMDVINTLSYLSEKYELVVLTNWFILPQVARLKNAKMNMFFKEFYGAEKVKKPNRDSFLLACGDVCPENCLMIGDNYNIDMVGASLAGLNVLYYNFKNKSNEQKFSEFKDFSDLKSIL